jgi:hypothetical protein
MSYPVPSQSTPAGCLVGFLALFPAVISALGWYGLYQWSQLPHKSQVIDKNFWALLVAAVLGPPLALILMKVAKRILKATNFSGYNPHDSSEPTIKF